ncbi:MAG TPA: aldehyde dehydrogenase family protein, partial [Vicinamibacterales bacterium]|nr:aldehyde dehydrogenase family protein [Vicinamibacterales bacterium]
MIAFPNVIDGQTSDAGERVPNINPSNLQDVIGDFAVATPADVHAAIAAARRAFAAWSQSSPQVRFDVLD